MSNSIIEIKNLGKKYNITHQRGGYVALRDVLMNVLKSPFSFIKSKAKQVAGIETKEEFWALKDINLEVQKGEVIGIIGANGAGKSTLLKILSQITPPTTGEIRINGTVSSLLEVGTGFHPELSGRENIFLNGAILGMTREEMAKKFDAIVEFAGIEKFLDTQVKHYSSGMYVRLAFSVAAHLEPDILIVDEVLAVGDAEFQKKCLGKMEEVTKKQGRTILFVSHNMGAIKQLCTKSILIRKGEIIKSGNTEDVISYYLNNHQTKEHQTSKFILNKKSSEPAQIVKIWVEDLNSNEIYQSEIKKDIILNVEFEISEPLKDLLVAFLIEKDATPIMYSYDIDNKKIQEVRENGNYRSKIILPFAMFKEGLYTIFLQVGCKQENVTNPSAFININVINTTCDLTYKSYKKDRPGFLIPYVKWETKKI